MIDFKNKDELTTNVVICGSLAVFLIAGACMALLPKPAGPNPKSQKIAANRIKAATIAMKEKVDAAKAELSTYTWPGTPDDIGPIALKQVNGLLQNRHLKLVGFHADKTIEEPNVTLIPFVMAVDGNFTSVIAFARDLEKPSTKLVVNMFQVSNADQGTDKVTASIGITAYQLPQQAVSSTPSPPVPASKAVKPILVKGVKKNA